MHFLPDRLSALDSNLLTVYYYLMTITTYTTQEYLELNDRVCSINEYGSVEFCPRECPKVTDDQGRELENSFNIYAGLCHSSEAVPDRKQVDQCRYSVKTLRLINGLCNPVCPIGYIAYGSRACSPVVKITPLPSFVIGREVVPGPVQMTGSIEAVQPPQLIRSGGDSAMTVSIGIVLIMLSVMLWDALTTIIA